MIVTVFRSRLKEGALAEYEQWAERIARLAQAMPGYLSHKGFTAADGERVTIVEFENEEAVRAWAAHPEHRAAKERGRLGFYSEYRIQVCTVLRENRFKAEQGD
jgi:heme-degrading monooxygenase HmoA